MTVWDPPDHAWQLLPAVELAKGPIVQRASFRMAITLSTHVENTKRSLLTVPKADLLDLLRACGKLPTSTAGNPRIDVNFDVDDGELQVAWTEQTFDVATETV